MTRVFVALGANLGDREATMLRAAELLGVTRISTIRETDPWGWGYAGQPKFLNAVAELDTELAPLELLDRLLAIEHELGREGQRYGPRTIDLDLLLYGSETIDEPGLTVPHPRLHERLFVLEPLAELDPELGVPGKGMVSELLAGLE